MAYRAVFQAARLGGLVLDDNCKWWGPDRHIVIYYVNPRKDELYFVTSVPDPEWKLDSWSAMGDLGDLRAAFKGFHGHVTQVLDACPSVHKWALADRDPMPHWSAGRVTLMGDAAHPMTPTMAQGAAQSLEDAMIMSRCLARFGFEDVASAFRTFEAHRRARGADPGHVAPQCVDARAHRRRLALRLRCLQRAARRGGAGRGGVASEPQGRTGATARAQGSPSRCRPSAGRCVRLPARIAGR